MLVATSPLSHQSLLEVRSVQVSSPLHSATGALSLFISRVLLAPAPQFLVGAPPTGPLFKILLTLGGKVNWNKMQDRVLL